MKRGIQQMILIAHRGNTRGPSHQLENSPAYIVDAIKMGYDVEVDVWLGSFYNKYGWYLGHDKPQYKVNHGWLTSHMDKLWFHAKNLDALTYLLGGGYNCFWHQKDKYTITSHGYIWVYPGEQTARYRTIAVLPERHQTPVNGNTCYGICSDYIERYKKYENATIENKHS